MARNDHDRGKEVHLLRSLCTNGGAYTWCNHVVMDERYTTIREKVTCENCKRSKGWQEGQQ